jgi:hypothetical protein
LTFRFYRFRFQFGSAGRISFPPYKSGNIVRGAFGSILRKLVCVPGCREAKVCDVRANCPYARIFEPQAARREGPSGLADWPRPFVFRAGRLDSRTLREGDAFHFDVHLFDTLDPPLPYFIRTFAQLAREGLGPTRARAELTAVDQLDLAGVTVAKVFPCERDPMGSGKMLLGPQATGEDACPKTQNRQLVSGMGQAYWPVEAVFQPPPLVKLAPPIAFHFDEAPRAVARATVRFVTPTELKSGGELAPRPEFGVLFRRLRDRISALCALYGEGPLKIDFRAMGDRAAQVRMTRCDLRRTDVDRVSSRTGQRHSLGGFVGEVEYEGDLGQFMCYLRLGHWVGVGRQTVWGKGDMETRSCCA